MRATGFTYGDSHPTFSPWPRDDDWEEYRRKLYTYDEILEVIKKYGLPQNWNNDGRLEGDCLLAVGDEELIKIHFHTNVPWTLLEYCASLGEIYDIVVEDMERQSKGLQG